MTRLPKGARTLKDIATSGYVSYDPPPSKVLSILEARSLARRELSKPVTVSTPRVSHEPRPDMGPPTRPPALPKKVYMETGQTPSVQHQVATKILEEGHVTRELSGGVTVRSTLERAARISKRAAVRGVPMTVETAFGRLASAAKRLGRIGGKLGGVASVTSLPSQYEEYKMHMKPLSRKEQERSARRM